MERRTEAGKVLEGIMRSHTCDPEVPNSFIEGAEATASAWVRRDDGKYFQVHVTELNPTESELEYFTGKQDKCPCGFPGCRGRHTKPRFD